MNRPARKTRYNSGAAWYVAKTAVSGWVGLFFLPALVPAIVFVIMPFITMVYLSFFKTDFIFYQFVGLYNYRRLFTDPRFWRVVLNSIIYAGIIIPVQTVIGLKIALFAYRLKPRARAVALVAGLLPSFTAGVIISTFVRWITHPTPQGLLNWMLGHIGIEAIQWMGMRFIAMCVISGMIVYAGLGTTAILFHSSFLAIPKAVLDAARIDGASEGQIRRRIMVPIIAPTIALVTLMMLVGAFMFWELFYIMAPVHTTRNLMYDTYATGFINGWFGLAATKTMALVSILLVLGVVKRRVERNV